MVHPDHSAVDPLDDLVRLHVVADHRDAQLGDHELVLELDAAAAFAGGSVGSTTGTLTWDVGPVHICIGRKIRVYLVQTAPQVDYCLLEVQVQEEKAPLDRLAGGSPKGLRTRSWSRPRSAGTRT